MKKIGIGVIGVGLRGQHSYEQILRHDPRVDVRAISIYPGISEALLEGKNESFFRQYSAELGAEYMGNDYKALLNRDDIEFISLMCQPDMALELGAACIDSSKAFLRDKPVTGTSQEALELQRLADDAGVFAGMAMPLRYHRPLVQVKDQIDGGAYGEIIAVKMSYVWNSGPLAGFTATKEYMNCYGGGDVTTAGFHAVDYLNWLIGVPPVRIFAQMGSFFYDDYKIIDMDDLGELVIEYANGAVANLLTGRIPSRSGNPNSLDITARGGSIEIRSFNSSIRVDGAGNSVRKAFMHDPLKDLTCDMLDAYERGDCPPVRVGDGAATLAVLQAARESARTGSSQEVKLQMPMEVATCSR